METFNNMPPNYITKLAHPIHLEGQWVVGLTEIHVPCTWYNVTKSNNLLLVYNSIDDQPRNIMSALYPCLLKPGYYSTPEELMDSLTKCIKLNTTHNMALGYKEGLNRISIKSDNHKAAIYFPKERSG